MILHQQVVTTSTTQVTPVAHLIRPADDRTLPGVVLIQEWWGIEPHVIDVAQRLAREGFVVIVPDLYNGQVTNEPDDARKLVMVARENIESVLRDVTLSADYLRNNMGVKPKHIGIMGFCMGGFVSFKMAERYPHFGAVSPWYGGGYAPTADDIVNVNAPVLAMYGENDGGIPLDQVRHVEATYKAAGKQIECRVYAGAGHAFLNPDHGAYHGPSAQDAWSRTIAFFREQLT